MPIHNITVKTALLSLLPALVINAYAQAPNSGFDIAIPESLTSDKSGTIFTTGTFNGTTDFDPGAGVFSPTTAGSSDIFISMLDANGDFMWVIQIGGTSFESASEITSDASGNTYVTGSFAGSVDFDPGAGRFSIRSHGTNNVFVNFVWAKSKGMQSLERKKKFPHKP